jgi:hypothetical protein
MDFIPFDWGRMNPGCSVPLNPVLLSLNLKAYKLGEAREKSGQEDGTGVLRNAECWGDLRFTAIGN